MTLNQLVDGDAKIDEIAQYLDSLAEAQRLSELYGLTGAHHKRLYEKAVDSPPLRCY